MNKQQGFGVIIITITVTAVLGLLVLGVFFITTKKPAPENTNAPAGKLTVPLTKKDPLLMETQSKIGTPECPEVDYTGCDTSGNFATWKDDGQRNVADTEDRINPYTGVIYSK